MRASGLAVQVIDTVTPALQAEVQAFWQRLKVAVNPDDGQRRLQAIVAVARSDDGALQAVATAPRGKIVALADTIHFYWRNLVAPAYRDTDVARSLYAAFYAHANARFQTSGGAIGIYTEMADELLEGPGVPARASIGDVPLYLIGHVSERFRARVSYFDGARISDESGGSSFDPLRELPDGYRMDVSPQGVTGEVATMVCDLWRTTGTLTEEYFEKRLTEVYITTWAPDGSVCGILTAYCYMMPRIEAPMHWVRAMVSPDHRKNNIPALMCARFLEDLQSRADAGEEVGSLGMAAEVHSETIRKFRNDAVWPATDAAFIGLSPHGFHLRASYLRGVAAKRWPIS